MNFHSSGLESSFLTMRRSSIKGKWENLELPQITASVPISVVSPCLDSSAGRPILDLHFPGKVNEVTTTSLWPLTKVYLVKDIKAVCLHLEGRTSISLKIS